MNVSREQSLAPLDRIARVLEERKAQLGIDPDRPPSEGLRCAPACHE